MNAAEFSALLVLATAPFIAALLSWLTLRETIDRATALAIGLVFAGVLIIGSGSMGHGRLLGDAFALVNATAIAAYYVTLRTTARLIALAICVPSASQCPAMWKGANAGSSARRSSSSTMVRATSGR